MKNQGFLHKLSSIQWIILIAAIVKFTIHLIYAPGYEFFGDELYTIALSRHLAWGYVDLPPLVPALVALSRALLGNSFFAYHIIPALAGSFTLVFIGLLTKEFGGKTFAVALSVTAFIAVPIWLAVDSIFCYDSIDQLMLAGFMYATARLLRSGNRKRWLLIGLIAGLACLSKITILFLGPGFLLALLLTKHRKDLLTPWPWLGALIFAIVLSPYVIWQISNHWPSLEYWTSYGTNRLYDASPKQYLVNTLVYMSPFLLPLYLAGLYRVFRTMNGTRYALFGFLFVFTVILMFFLHSSARMLAELFMPIIAAGALFWEEVFAKIPWRRFFISVSFAVLAAIIIVNGIMSIPILPADVYPIVNNQLGTMQGQLREFNGGASYYSVLYADRLGWTQLVQNVAEVYNALPQDERAVAGIYADWYMPAGAVDQYGPQYGLPHAVSGHLTYYLWGPGYSWDVMIMVTGQTNNMSVFYNQCELAKKGNRISGIPAEQEYIYVCREPKVSAEKIWSSAKMFR